MPSHSAKLRKAKLSALLLGGALFCVLGFWGARAQNPVSGSANLSATPWRPKNDAVAYVGAAACVKCHAGYAKQLQTGMGKALETVAESVILRENPLLTFKSGPYAYELKRQGEQSIYTVTDGKNTLTVPLLYSFGQGKAGQTYLFQYNGSYYESRLSFFKEIKGLDWTIGYPRDVPPSLEAAAGRAISLDEARNCFTCHATAATSGLKLRLDRLQAGVSCEACHGPGANHVALAQAEKPSGNSIFNPAKMDADQLTQEFCGSCHRSAEDVAANKGLHGVTSVRFQPYRLFTSRGHDPFDPRLSCVACHNPHDPTPKHDEAYYDAKCTVCHQVKNLAAKANQEARPCPVSQKQCATCHMPKVSLEGSHFLFTDHRIRIARAGEPFPN